jgi:tRNA(Arg) A34 adenosine deaminase TadA
MRAVEASGIATENMHERWMTKAVSIGLAGMQENGGGPFGAIIVRGGELISTGWNQVTRSLDPTAHAEVSAIRNACQRLASFDLRGCDLYTSCEPCPMCLAATYWARIDRMFFGCTRADAAAAGFDDDFIYQQIGLETSARSLPMAQVGRETAMQLFSDWALKHDKIPY